MTVWSSVAFIIVLALAGNAILRLWTHGHVNHGGLVLDLLLISAALEGAWLTAASVLFFTNRHERIGLAYALVWIAGLPLAYGLTSSVRTRGRSARGGRRRSGDARRGPSPVAPGGARDARSAGYGSLVRPAGDPGSARSAARPDRLSARLLAPLPAASRFSERPR